MDNQQAVYTVYLSYSLDGRMYIGSAKNIKPSYFGSFTDKTFKPKGIARLEVTP